MSLAEVKFVKLNVDEAPAVAQQFSVMNIPTILAFEGGEASTVGRAQGQAHRRARRLPGLILPADEVDAATPRLVSMMVRRVQYAR